MLVPEEIEVFASTDVGRKRKHNEDNYLIDNELRLFVVADGMGGHAAGEVASAMAVQSIRDIIAAKADKLAERAKHGNKSGVSIKSILSLLEAAVQRASARIHAEARKDRKKRGMGTTVSLILFLGSHGYVAHVGDSRIYLMRNGTVHQVTEDHTIANELLKLGMVKPEQLAQVPRKNAITRAVGVYEHVEVDTMTLEVLPNDRFVLASDGLTGYLDDDGERLTGLLQEEDGQLCVQAMIDYANGRGGKDNVTAILVKLGGDADAAGALAKRLRMKRQVLATMPLFRKLSHQELYRILHVASLRRVKTGDDAIVEGQSGDRMFVVLSGEFNVLKGAAVLRKLGPGEHFGEMALLRNTHRSATVRAAQDSELVVMKRSDFFEIIRSEPHIAVKLLWQFLGVLADRLDQTSTDLQEAREELEGEPAMLVEVDPFTPVPGTLAMQLDEDGSPAIEEPHTFPGFDDAPEMAVRLDRAVPLDSPTFEDAPAMAVRREKGHPRETASSAAPTRRRDTVSSPPPPPVEARRGGPASRPTLQMTRTTMPSPATADIDDLAKTRVRQAVLPPEATPGPPRRSASQGGATEKDAPSDKVSTEVAAGNGRPASSPSSKSPATKPSPDMAPAAGAKRVKKASSKKETKVRSTADDAKKTLPFEPGGGLQEELQSLRKQFKERLKASSRSGEPKDSD